MATQTELTLPTPVSRTGLINHLQDAHRFITDDFSSWSEEDLQAQHGADHAQRTMLLPEHNHNEARSVQS